MWKYENVEVHEKKSALPTGSTEIQTEVVQNNY